MGARKKNSADKRKEAMKTVAIARLRDVPTSPRKMRQVADIIRGKDVNKALDILRFSTRHSSRRPGEAPACAPSPTGRRRTKARRRRTQGSW